jgi:hypothetical protein
VARAILEHCLRRQQGETGRQGQATHQLARLH